MAKTQKELEQIKQEYKVISDKLKELTNDELKIVVGELAYGDSQTLGKSVDVNEVLTFKFKE